MYRHTFTWWHVWLIHSFCRFLTQLWDRKIPPNVFCFCLIQVWKVTHSSPAHLLFSLLIQEIRVDTCVFSYLKSPRVFPHSPASTTWSMVGKRLNTAVLTERRMSRADRLAYRIMVRLSRRPRSSLPWTPPERTHMSRSGRGMLVYWFHQRFTTSVT